MYFILNGNYRVQSVMFDMKNRQKEISDILGSDEEKSCKEKILN